MEILWISFSSTDESFKLIEISQLIVVRPSRNVLKKTIWNVQMCMHREWFGLFSYWERILSLRSWYKWLNIIRNFSRCTSFLDCTNSFTHSLILFRFIFFVCCCFFFIFHFCSGSFISLVAHLKFCFVTLSQKLHHILRENNHVEIVSSVFHSIFVRWVESLSMKSVHCSYSWCSQLGAC